MDKQKLAEEIARDYALDAGLAPDRSGYLFSLLEKAILEALDKFESSLAGKERVVESELMGPDQRKANIGSPPETSEALAKKHGVE